MLQKVWQTRLRGILYIDRSYYGDCLEELCTNDSEPGEIAAGQEQQSRFDLAVPLNCFNVKCSVPPCQS
eukprot:g48860.t1